MRYMLYVHAYDVLDKVNIGVTVRDVADEDREPVLQLSNTVQGIGESDVREWTRDALVAALEQL